MWLGSGAGGTWWTVKDPTLALLKGQAGRGFQKMLLSVPKNSRQLGIAGAATGRASGGEELGKQRVPSLRDGRMWESQTS